MTIPHFLSLEDYSATQVREILNCGQDLKNNLKSGQRPRLLAEQVVGLLFQKPSLRTRVSFEALSAHLGAKSLYLGADVGWGEREPNQDFIPVLTSYLDLLVIRAKKHEAVVEAARYSQCPVINGLTDYNHPCQALADVMTVMEHSENLSETKICYVGDGNNVARSLATVCSQLEIDFSIAAPIGYHLENEFIGRLDKSSSAAIKQTSDLSEAVDQADFVYTDVWTSMGQEAESEKRRNDFAEFEVNESLMSRAANGAKFLHCLPARRGEEVTAEVIEGPRSLVVQQAENRMHAQKGLVVWLKNQQK